MHQSSTDQDTKLVWTRLPSGEWAYLKSEDNEPRYWPTDKAIRALRMLALFGDDAA